MQVRSRGPARGAHGADVLALFDGLALLHPDAAQMGVDGDVLVAVLDEHHVAEAVLHTRELDHAVTHGAHRRARRRSEVGAEVGAPGFVDGVEAHGEPTGDAGELHRRGQIGAAQALAVEGVVGAAAGAGLLEPHRLVGLAVVLEFGAQHPSGAQGFAVGFEGFVNDGKAVTLAQGTAEVDVAREQLSHLHRNGVGDACGIGGGKQRALDHAARQPAGGGECCGLDARGKPCLGFFDHEALEITAVVGRPARRQAQQAVVVRCLGRCQAAGAAHQVLLHMAVAPQEGGCGRVCNTHALQERLHRVAAADLLGAEQRKTGLIGHFGQRQTAGQGRDGQQDLAHRQVGRVGGQLGHGERAAAAGQQQGRQQGGDTFRVILDALGDAVAQCEAGVGQAGVQESIPRVSARLAGRSGKGARGCKAGRLSVPQDMEENPQGRAT